MGTDKEKIDQSENNVIYFYLMCIKLHFIQKHGQIDNLAV